MSAALGYRLEARTCAWLVSLGYRAERVARTGRRNGGDLFACVDIVSVHPEHGVELHQSTTKTNASARRRKIRAAELPQPVRLWLWNKDARGRWVFTSETVEPA